MVAQCNLVGIIFLEEDVKEMETNPPGSICRNSSAWNSFVKLPVFIG
jgi:hypothetical protein